MGTATISLTYRPVREFVFPGKLQEHITLSMNILSLIPGVFKLACTRSLYCEWLVSALTPAPTGQQVAESSHSDWLPKIVASFPIRLGAHTSAGTEARKCSIFIGCADSPPLDHFALHREDK